MQNKTELGITIALSLTALFISYVALINRENSRVRLLPYPQIEVHPVEGNNELKSMYQFLLPEDSLVSEDMQSNQKIQKFSLKFKITNKSITPISQLRFIARSDDYELNPYVVIKQEEYLYCNVDFNLFVSENVIYRIPLEIIYRTVSDRITYRERIVLHFDPENIGATETIIQKTSVVFIPFLNDFLDPCLRIKFDGGSLAD